MANKKESDNYKIHKSCTLSPEIVKATHAYIRDPAKVMTRSDGYHEPPRFNTVIEIAMRKLLGLKPAPSDPINVDEAPEPEP